MTSDTAPPDAVVLEMDPDDLLDTEAHATGLVQGIWRSMRARAPLFRHAEGVYPAFTSVTRHADVVAVYRDADVFSSRFGVMLRPLAFGDDPGGGLSLALTDPPRHRQTRTVIADFFNEAGVARLRDDLTRFARGMLDAACDVETVDAAHDIGVRFTLEAVTNIIGVPESDRDSIASWTAETFASGTSLATRQDVMRYFIDLMDARQETPQDDITSRLVQGWVCDRRLTPEEVLLNLENILGATENAGLSIASSMLALADRPDLQRRIPAEGPSLATAVEELLRWASSATHSLRTVTRDVDLQGTHLTRGDRVVVWLPSANRDEEAFRDAEVIDLDRRPNRHVALGHGEHFCLGAALARSQMRILISELSRRRAIMTRAGDPTMVRSLVVNGPTHLPLSITRG